MVDALSDDRKKGEAAGRSVIPQLGFGTYQTGGYECFEAVQQALDAGYRHIDTAMAYENEAAVGRAMEVSSVDREEVFLTTKLKGYPEFLDYEPALEQIEGCLDRLGVDTIDLLLLHWWSPAGDMEQTFAALDRLVDEGKVDHIGVSNFSVEQLQRARDVSDSPICTNQVEHHPYWTNDEMLRYCQTNDVTLTAYSPLAEGLVANDEGLAAIGNRYDKSAAQVAIRWLIQQENVVTIPKTVTASRMGENIDVFDFELTETEMEAVGNAEAPFWYRTNREGGHVYRARSLAGSMIPEQVADRLL